MKSRPIRILLVLAWALFLGVLSFLPNHDKRLLHTHGKYHLLGHAIAFTIGSVLISRCSRHRSVQFFLLLGAACIAFLLEYSQHIVYHTEIEGLDILMDLLGLALGFSLVQAFHTSSSRTSRLH